MILLRDSEDANRLAEVDPEREELRVLPAAIEISEPEIRGVFGQLDGHRLALYAYERRLWLQIDGRKVEVDRSMRGDVRRYGDEGRLKIRSGESLVAELKYRAPSRDELEFDFTAGAESEDADFGLFVANVINDPERRQVLLDRDAALSARSAERAPLSKTHEGGEESVDLGDRFERGLAEAGGSSRRGTLRRSGTVVGAPDVEAAERQWLDAELAEIPPELLTLARVEAQRLLTSREAINTRLTATVTFAGALLAAALALGQKASQAHLHGVLHTLFGVGYAAAVVLLTVTTGVAIWAMRPERRPRTNPDLLKHYAAVSAPPSEVAQDAYRFEVALIDRVGAGNYRRALRLLWASYLLGVALVLAAADALILFFGST